MLRLSHTPRSHLEGLSIVSRRDYDEGREDARQEMRERELGSSTSGSGNSGFTVAAIVKYVAIVVIVIIIAYVVLRILNTVGSAL